MDSLENLDYKMMYEEIWLVFLILEQKTQQFEKPSSSGKRIGLKGQKQQKGTPLITLELIR